MEYPENTCFQVIDLFIPDPTRLLEPQFSFGKARFGTHLTVGATARGILSIFEGRECGGELILHNDPEASAASVVCNRCNYTFTLKPCDYKEVRWQLLHIVWACGLAELSTRGRRGCISANSRVQCNWAIFLPDSILGDVSFDRYVSKDIPGRRKWNDYDRSTGLTLKLSILPTAKYIAVANVRPDEFRTFENGLVEFATIGAFLMRRMECLFQGKIDLAANTAKSAPREFHLT